MRLVKILIPLVFLTGCHGWAPLWSQANPETSVEFDPLSHTVRFYSNDGRSLKLEGLSLEKKADGSIVVVVKNMECAERSVENRQANVGQLLASAQVQAQINGMVSAIMGPLGVAMQQGAIHPATSASFDPKTGTVSFTQQPVPLVPPYTPPATSQPVQP